MRTHTSYLAKTQMKNRVTCADRSQWREWLQDNHEKQTEVWLVLFKKSTGNRE